jgi:putative endonuclease
MKDILSTIDPDSGYVVYMLECADGTLYTGSTNNIHQRIHLHNTSARGAKYTRVRRPVHLVYLLKCTNISHARKEEARLKRLTRAEKLTHIASVTQQEK